ncbi:hypothetical protein RCL1_001780 [Eukaryota sp. TZLM3-RCL]
MHSSLWTLESQCFNVGKRRGSSLLSDNSNLYLFGGSDSLRKDNNDLHRLRLNSSSRSFELIQTHGTLPSPRSYACSGIIDNTLYVFGGESDSSCLGDLFALNLNTFTWTPILTEISPPPRFAASMCVYGNCIILFGGAVRSSPQRDVHGSPLHYLNDLWVFNTALMTWNHVTLTSSPSGRYGATLNVVGDSLFLFGGFNGDKSDELFELIFDSNHYDTTLSTIISRASFHLIKPLSLNPSPRHFHVSFSVEINGHSFLVIFGGFGGQTFSDCTCDLWLYDPAATRFSQIFVTPGPSSPSPRAQMGSSGVGSLMYLFGGVSNGVESSQLWSLNVGKALESNNPIKSTSCGNTESLSIKISDHDDVMDAVPSARNPFLSSLLSSDRFVKVVQKISDQSFRNVADDVRSVVMKEEESRKLMGQKVENELTSMKAKIAIHVNSIDRLKSTVDSIAQAFDDRVLNVESKVDSSTQSIKEEFTDLINSVVDKVDSQIDNVDSSSRTLISTAIKTINHNVANQKTELEILISELKVELETFVSESNLTSLEKFDSIISDLTVLERRIDTFASESISLYESVNSELVLSINDIRKMIDCNQDDVIQLINQTRLTLDSLAGIVSNSLCNLRRIGEKVELMTCDLSSIHVHHDAAITNLSSGLLVLDQKCENLEATIEEKCGLIDGKIEILGGNIENFDQKIGTLEVEFCGKFENLHSNYSDLSQNFELLSQNFENKFETLENNFTDSFGKSLQGSNEILSQNIETLSQTVESNFENFTQNIGKLAEKHENLESNLLQHSEQFEHKLVNLEQKIESFESELTNFKSENESTLQTIRLESSNSTENLTQKIESLAENFDEKLVTVTGKFDTEIEKLEENFVSLRAEIGSVSQNFTVNFENLESKFGAIQLLQTENENLTQNFVSLSQKYDTLSKQHEKLDEKYENLVENFENSKVENIQLKSEVVSLQSKIENLESKFENFFKLFQEKEEANTSKFENIDVKVSNLDNSTNQSINDISQSVTSNFESLSTLITDISTKSSTFETEVTTKIENFDSKLQNFDSKIQNVDDSLKNLINDERSRVQNSLIGMCNQLSAVEANMSQDLQGNLANINGKFSKINGKFSNVEQNIESLQSKISQLSSSVVDNLEQNIVPLVSKLEDSLNSKISTEVSIIQSKISEIEQLHSQSNSTIHESINQKQSELIDLISTRRSELFDNIVALNTEFVTFQCKIMSSFERNEEGQSELIEQLKKNQSEFESKVLSQISTVEEQFSAKISEVSANLESESQMFTSKISEVSKLFEKRMISVINQTISDVYKRITRVDTNLNEKITTSGSKMVTIGQSISDLQRTLTTSLDFMSGEISKIESEFSNSISELRSELLGHKKRISSLSQSSSDL